jgi:aminopeptidase N
MHKIKNKHLEYFYLGNLVTFKWWNQLWLSEGFATHFEIISIDFLKSTSYLKDTIILGGLERSFSYTQPLSTRIENFSMLETTNQGTYTKGASIIRMAESFLTKKVFKTGITNFLRKFSFKNAEQDDLFEELAKVAYDSNILNRSISLKGIMDTWTLQSDYPIVKVTRNYTTNEVFFEQEKFTKKSESSDENMLWWIPITYTSESEANFDDLIPKYWLNEKFLRIQVPVDNTQWLIVNLQRTGFFRVNYDAENWKLISNFLNDPINYKIIPKSNRYQLINDILALIDSGHVTYTVFLDMTKYLIFEDDLDVWGIYFDEITKIHEHINHELFEASFDKNGTFN